MKCTEEMDKKLEIGRIIHLIGPKCAGKTTLLKQLRKLPVWDIAEFYKKHKIINADHSMNWVYYRQRKRRLIPALHRWLEAQRCEIAYIETSGINSDINQYLEGLCFGMVKTIMLESPAPGELKSRCRGIGASYGDMLKYNNKWMSKALVLYPYLRAYTYQEARQNGKLWIFGDSPKIRS